MPDLHPSPTTRHPAAGPPGATPAPTSTPALMGILNITPDSFSDGGRHLEPSAAVAAGLAMREVGAAWLDIGGESSRPGSRPVPPAEERDRVEPVITALRERLPEAALSLDTRRAALAAWALAAGVRMINDISAGADPEMFAVLADHDARMCLMHMQGTPETMQAAPHYASVVDEVEAFFATRVAAAERAGLARERLLLDPGIGFGKTLAHNRELLAALPRLRSAFGLPLLVGLSRKRLIPNWLGRDVPPAERDHLSHLLHVQVAPHCDILRVHDVAGARDACRLALTIPPPGGGP